jgi:hypothetical protein
MRPKILAGKILRNKFIQRLKQIFSKSGVAAVAMALTALPSLAGATPLRATDREAYRIELSSLFQTMDTYYGPLELKKTTIGLNWPQRKVSYASRIDNLQSSNDFYFLISDVLNSLNDAHVAMELPSTLKWTLPLQFSSVEGSVIVSYYDNNEMYLAHCPVNVGDELVQVGGQSLNEVQASQPVFAKYGNPITNRSMFSRMLTSLNEARGVRLADFGGPVKEFTFHKLKDGAEFKCSLTYKATGVGMIDRSALTAPPPKIATDSDRDKFNQQLDSILSKDGNLITFSNEQRDKMFNAQQVISKVHALLDLTTSLDLEANPLKASGAMGKQLGIGDLEPFFTLPANFKKIEFPAFGALLNSDAYYAGTFEHNGKTVGFLRIPSYMPSVIYTMPIGLRYVISKLQKTDYLIIDQTNNPGGMVAYSDMIVKSLTGLYDISKHLRFVVKPTQAYLSQFNSIINLIETDTTGALPADAKALLPQLKANYDRIHKAYVNHANLSEPISMMVFTKFVEIVLDQLYAQIPFQKFLEQYIGAAVFSPQVYEYPVYMMINEFDFSGGDATPATLQDYGRVKLIGVRTAGAGGSVEEFRNTISADYKYHLTTSLMLRKNDTYVENYGVLPDIDLPLKKIDYINGFSQVLNNVLTKIDSQGH